MVSIIVWVLVLWTKVALAVEELIFWACLFYFVILLIRCQTSVDRDIPRHEITKHSLPLGQTNLIHCGNIYCLETYLKNLGSLTRYHQTFILQVTDLFSLEWLYVCIFIGREMHHENGIQIQLRFDVNNVIGVTSVTLSRDVSESCLPITVNSEKIALV